MNMFPIQTEVALAMMAVTFFLTGWMSQRFLRSRGERQAIEQLTDNVANLERQSDVAHRSALDLAAANARLMSEHQEAQWMIQSLKSDNRLRETRIEQLLEDHESRHPAVNEEIWSSDNRQSGAANSCDR